jgi:hypothetical protein
MANENEKKIKSGDVEVVTHSARFPKILLEVNRCNHDLTKSSGITQCSKCSFKSISYLPRLNKQG